MKEFDNSTLPNLRALFLNIIEMAIDKYHSNGNIPNSINVWNLDEFSMIMFGKTGENIKVFGIPVFQSDDTNVLIRVF